MIASMTIGKDVGSLFPHVLKNIQTEDMELKKLVYLYLMNYAKSQPELVVLAINTFCKVIKDDTYLIYPNDAKGLGRSQSIGAGSGNSYNGLSEGGQGDGLFVRAPTTDASRRKCICEEDGGDMCGQGL